MPGVDGIEATRTIVQEDGSIRVLGLTIFDNDAYAVRMLKAGATGFVLKDSTADQLVDAIRSAHHGTLTVAPATARDRVQLVLWAHRNGVLPVSSESAGSPEGPGGGDASDRGV